MLDTRKLPESVEALAEATLRSEGHTSIQLREAIESRAAVLSGGMRRLRAVPAVLQPYVDKVAMHAHRITDDDVRSLKEAGLTEDEIFEITLCAALGAGLARFERGIAALNEREGLDATREARAWTHP